MHNLTTKHDFEVTLSDRSYYRVVELDGADVILGQGNASILRVDEQEPLREENDFPYDDEHLKQTLKMRQICDSSAVCVRHRPEQISRRKINLIRY